MFTLTDADFARISEWKAEQPKPSLKEIGLSMTGAIGGRWTYSFTPTSLGLIVKVKDGMYGGELDLSNYEDW